MGSRSLGKQYNAIDLAKFLCAILVVTIHVSPFGNAYKTGSLAFFNHSVQNYLARIAVPFFFVSSGFFLFQKTNSENFNIQVTKKYVLKLFKLYLIWSAVYLPLNIILFFRDNKGIFHAILIYIRNFIFDGSYYHLWYVPAAIFAVALISVLLYKRVTPKKILIIAGVFYIAGLFDQSWFGFIEPLILRSHYIWKMRMLVQNIIVTTRNGLFEGFLFAGIGMYFACCKVNISRKHALMGFIISMLLMAVEAFTVIHFNIARAYNMYLFLVPAVFYMFLIVRDTELPDSKIYKSLRILSQLIYFMHIWVLVVVDAALSIIDPGLEKTSLRFVLILFTTIICSIIVMKISDFSKFKWLKKLYS
ncbi:MAG: acyltransferase [Oscillospiraceae bacterium]|nr:acyltransferase [Oscillospiraceae bacterium]